jgi:transcriptional regulator with XRE-family HTH domain
MNIKKLRLAKNMTQTELADAVGVSLRQVCNWERDGLPAVYPRLKLLERILL